MMWLKMILVAGKKQEKRREKEEMKGRGWGGGNCRSLSLLPNSDFRDFGDFRLPSRPGASADRDSAGLALSP